MEFTKEHPTKRWVIVAPSYGSCREAVHTVSAALRANLPYIPPVLPEEPGYPCGVVRVFVDPALEPDRIRIDAENDRASVSGGSETACMYAAFDFADGWLTPLLGRRAGDHVTIRVSDAYSYEVEVRAIEKGKDDASLPITSF